MGRPSATEEKRLKRSRPAAIISISKKSKEIERGGPWPKRAEVGNGVRQVIICLPVRREA